MSGNRDFWDRQEPHSKAKTDIVTNYFVAWSNVMKHRCERLTYLDLCSGRGQYRDGVPSTPLRILSAAKEITELQSKLQIHFYEKAGTTFEELAKFVSEHEACRWLNRCPLVHPETVGRELIASLPIDDCTLTFLDPHGYNELSLDLLETLVEGWGSDCIFFLSVTGIHRNLKQAQNAESLQRIFTSAGYDRLLRRASTNETTFHRSLMMEMMSTLKNRRKLFVIPFAFEAEGKRIVTHYLFFVTKHVLGFSIMKDVMAKYSLCDSFGEPIYRYRSEGSFQLEYPKTYLRLTSRLTRDFAGRTIKIEDLIDSCHKMEYYAPTKVIQDAIEVLVDSARITVREKKVIRGKLSKKSVVTFG